MYKHPTGNWPKRVALIALGSSSTGWDHNQLHKGNKPIGDFDEVWTINRGLRLWRHDFGFVMDDLWRERAEDPEYGKFLQHHEEPYVTSVAYDDFPAVEYPLTEIAQMLAPARVYLTNSVPMAIAYAEFIGVEELAVIGADYTLPTGQVVEDGRSNVEYMLGRWEAQGRKLIVPGHSTLLGGRQRDYIYGYDIQWEARQRVKDGIDAWQDEVKAEEAQASAVPVPSAALFEPPVDDPIEGAYRAVEQVLQSAAKRV